MISTFSESPKADETFFNIIFYDCVICLKKKDSFQTKIFKLFLALTVYLLKMGMGSKIKITAVTKLFYSS